MGIVEGVYDLLWTFRYAGGVKYVYLASETVFVVSVDFAESRCLCSRNGCQFRAKKKAVCKHVFYSLWNDRVIPTGLIVDFLKQAKPLNERGQGGVV